jgi:hypothetical protein
MRRTPAPLYNRHEALSVAKGYSKRHYVIVQVVQLRVHHKRRYQILYNLNYRFPNSIADFFAGKMIKPQDFNLLSTISEL